MYTIHDAHSKVGPGTEMVDLKALCIDVVCAPSSGCDSAGCSV